MNLRMNTGFLSETQNSKIASIMSTTHFIHCLNMIEAKHDDVLTLKSY